LLWGEAPLISIVEPYTGAPGNRRLVQYFDRGRMELDVVSGAVTQGQLVRELTSGTVQIGDDSFAQESPAEIPIMATSSNEGVDAGPTYADFAAIAREPALDRTTSPAGVVADWLLPGGEILSSAPPAAASAALYVEQTGHNIPDVTVGWFASEPFGALNWQEALGLPVSESYWIQADGQERLVQLYERRVVVFTPAAAVGEQFTLTNTGRHYYRWRYGEEPGGGGSNVQLSSAPDIDVAADLVMPRGYRATTLSSDATDIVDLAIAPDSRLLVAHASGSVTVIAPNGGAEQVMVDGLSNPVAVTSVGSTIYVVDTAGLHRFQDIDSDGTIDGSEATIPLPFDPATVTLSPGADGALYLCGVEANGSNHGFVTLMRWDEATGRLDLAPATFGADGVFVVDLAGAIWAADPSGELARFTVDEPTRGVLSLQGIAAPTPTVQPDDPAAQRTIRDLLLYRPDGTIGDPLNDMLALVSDADGGRIVRLRPSGGTSNATPTTNSLSGAIVDFITGFSNPVAVVLGMCGL
jgi:hypothetical protein